MRFCHTFSSSNILTRRLTSRVVSYYFLTFFLLFGLLLSILCPLLFRSSLKKSKEYAKFTADQYHQALSSMQANMDAMIYGTNVSSLLQVYADTPSDSNKAIVEQALQSFLSSFSKIKFCMIETEDETLLRSFSNSSTKAMELCSADTYYQALKENANYSYYSAVLPYDLFENQGSFPCYSIFSSRKVVLNNHTYIFTLFYNIDDCIFNSQRLGNDVFSTYWVLSRTGNTIYSASSEKLPLSRETVGAFSQNVRYTAEGVYCMAKINSIGWTIITFSSWLDFFSGLYPVLGTVILFFLLPPLLFYFTVVPINNKFLKPLSVLTHQIARYSAGQDMKTEIHTGDEIEQLSVSINEMIEKINTQIEDIKRHERQNCITQYSLLATQIDPHFIYNTLNMINILARQNDQKDICAVNTALSKILKERFSTKASIFETIENELDTIEQYYIIMKYRYQNHVLVNIDAETSLMHEKIPKNLLIPIIENSFYHGLSKDNGIIQGQIDITIYSIHDTITIEISDDGAGISEEKAAYLKAHQFRTPDKDRTHIGLSNVYERLQYIYHEDFILDLSSHLGFGTTFSISIPRKKATAWIEEL